MLINPRELRQEFPCTGKPLFGHRVKIPCTGKSLFGHRLKIPCAGKPLFGRRVKIPCTGKPLYGRRLKIPCAGKAVTKERAAIGLPVLCDISVTDTVSAAAVPAPNQSPYSSQLRMSRSSSDKVQKALMKALARRALVISGIFRSMAARRIL